MRTRLFIFSFNLICAVFFVTLFFWTVDYIGELYVSVVNKNAVNEKSAKRFEDFYNLPDNSLQMAFVGSSHSYCTFDPENFDSVFGTSGFQLGMPLQHPDTTYYTVRELFNYQNPELIVVEVYWDLLSKDSDIKQALTSFQYMKNEELEKEYVNEVFGIGGRIKYNMDILNYQKDYFTYKTEKIKENIKKITGVVDLSQQQKGEEYYKAKGYVYCNWTIEPDEFGRTNQFNGFDGRAFEISPKQQEYLRKLVELCRKKDTLVIFVTAPVANVSLKKIKNYELVNKKVANLAHELSVPYIDYNMPAIRGDMFIDANFRDDAHLNDSGVKILNEHFIKLLRENSDFGGK